MAQIEEEDRHAQNLVDTQHYEDRENNNSLSSVNED